MATIGSVAHTTRIVKNQYFGDVNDYRKYGILRILAGRDLNVVVSWMLTPDDGRTDGKFIGYLGKEDRWRRHDPALFDHLRASLQDGAQRAVNSIESDGLLGRATFVSDLLLDQAASRSAWLDRTCAAARDADLVFFDPDNGLQVKSVRKGRKGSGKYLYWDEVQKVWECGASLLIYQHFPRAERSQFLQAVGDELGRRLGVSDVVALKTANVAFFLVTQDRHRDQLTSRLSQIDYAWHGQVKRIDIRPSASVAQKDVPTVEDTTSRIFMDMGRYVVSRSQHELWRAGKLHRVWAEMYPILFDDDDVRLAEGRYAQGRHFWEWLSAILLHHTTGYHCLLAIYEFGNHPRKVKIASELLDPDLLAICRDRQLYGSAQAPDLLMFDPDTSDWFFCEVKGHRDKLSRAQMTKFTALAEATGRPVGVINLRRVAGRAG